VAARRFRDGLVIATAIVVGGGAALIRSRRRPTPPPEPPVSVTHVPGAQRLDAGPPAPPSAIAPEIDAPLGPEPTSVAEQRAGILAALQSELHVPDAEIDKLRAIFDAAPFLGQGNPKVTVHPMTRQQCREIRVRAGLKSITASVCGQPNMVPIPTSADAAPQPLVCIDQYEFPNIPCEYPVVHVSARDAALICEALGKRLCDAHEWEGACAGELRSIDAEYTWKYERETRTLFHNRDREIVWAYGTTKDHSRCATGAQKTRHCEGGFTDCGSNTYPAGAFPECVSRFGVYDQHGNAAEHMNLPLEVSELTSRGGHGWTEMKGSWFFFSSLEAHADDCRWRAPSWHVTKLMDINSHSNYHLGFRCCKSIEGR